MSKQDRSCWYHYNVTIRAKYSNRQPCFWIQASTPCRSQRTSVNPMMSRGWLTTSSPNGGRSTSPATTPASTWTHPAKTPVWRSGTRPSTSTWGGLSFAVRCVSPVCVRHDSLHRITLWCIMWWEIFRPTKNTLFKRKYCIKFELKVLFMV